MARILEKKLFSRRGYNTEPVLSAVDSALGDLADAWFNSLRVLVAQGKIRRQDLGTAVSCLFDFAMSGMYANALIDQDGRLTRPALVCGENAVLPYTWMCPLCVAAGRELAECYPPDAKRKKARAGGFRDYPDPHVLAKPGARAIGDAGATVLKAIISSMHKGMGLPVKLREGGGRRGEFDYTLTTPNILALVEVKAKPLIAYPIVIHSISNFSDEHRWERSEAVLEKLAAGRRISLFLAARNEPLDLKVDFGDTWPLNSLIAVAGDPDAVWRIFDNWMQHFVAYRKWKDEPDRLRWHRFGCGNFSHSVDGCRIEKRVANTKELPGLDRTDDIKKGVAQLLLWGQYKFGCRKNALRTVLIGNLYAETHHSDYFEPIIDWRVSRPKPYGEALGGSSAEHWLLDAVIGFSRDHFNASDLHLLFSLDAILRVCEEGGALIAAAAAHGTRSLADQPHRGAVAEDSGGSANSEERSK